MGPRSLSLRKEVASTADRGAQLGGALIDGISLRGTRIDLHHAIAMAEHRGAVVDEY